MVIRKDIASLILFYILVLVNQFYLIPVHVLDEGSDPVYPYLLNGILFFLLICYTTETIYCWCKKRRSLSTLNLVPKRIGKIILLLILVAMWAFLLDSLGFILPTMTFLGITTWLYGERSLKVTIAAMILGSALLYSIFTIFGVVLPQGIVEQSLGNLISGPVMK